MSGDEFSLAGNNSISVRESHVGWKFFLLWIIANTLGFLVGGLGFILAFILFEAWGDAAVLISAGLIMGLTLGVMQWLVLRRYIGLSNRWIIATIAGFALGEIVAAIISLLENGIPDLAFVVIVSLIVGTAQWLVLRHYVSRAGWWILAIIAASVFDESLLASLWSGFITGMVLVWLIRKSTYDKFSKFPSQIESEGA